MKINETLLIDVLSLQSNHKNHNEVIDFVDSFVSKLKFKVKYTQDKYGNLYIEKSRGNNKIFPCVVAHMDTVHDYVSDKKVFKYGDILFAYSEEEKGAVGIGGDDYVGVYMALQLLVDLPNIKISLFKDEEVGCLGSKQAVMSFYNDCSFVLQCDRRGHREWVTNASGTELSGVEFQNAIDPYLKKYGFKKVTGLSTDVMQLKNNGLGICTANISSAYYNPHTSDESVSISGVTSTYSLMHEIIFNLGQTVFKHKTEPVVYKKYVQEGSTSNNSKTYGYGIYSSSKLGPNLPVTSTNKLFKKDLLFDETAYDYLSDSLLELSVIGCAKCKSLNSIGYLTGDKRFMCVNCADEVDLERSMKLYNNLTVSEGPDKYVYAVVLQHWIKQEEAQWIDALSSYVPKINAEKWEKISAEK
jgi:tripeptide aminopeptidase